jgi:hypothetical protein
MHAEQFRGPQSITLSATEGLRDRGGVEPLQREVRHVTGPVGETGDRRAPGTTIRAGQCAGLDER